MMRANVVSALVLTSVLALAPSARAIERQHPAHPTPPQKPQAPKADPKKEKPKPDPQKPARPANEKPKPAEAEDHSAHMAQDPKEQKAAQQPKEPIPVLTDADRAAAFPPGLHGHAVHDRAINYMFLFDQLEWQGTGTGGPSWENTSWIGGDRTRLWIRTEGET